MIIGKLMIDNVLVIENLIIPDDVLRFFAGAIVGLLPFIIRLKEQKCK